MVKKWVWAVPLSIACVGAVTAAVVGGYFANNSSYPFRSYYSSPVTNSNNSMMQMYFAAAVNGTRLLVLPGYSHTIPLTQLLAKTESQNAPIYNTVNKTGFILLDDSYGLPAWNGDKLDLTTAQPLWSTHVAAVQFRTDLGSFITGIAAGEFLNEYQYYFAPNPNDDLTFATYGGGAFSSVTGYMGGFQRGLRYFNNYIAPFAKTANGKPFKKIKQLFIGDTENTNFTNGFGTTQGDTLINAFLARKVDMLVPVAGTQTEQAVRLIKQSNSRTVVLGVDSADELNTNSNLPLPIPGSEVVNGSSAIGGTNKVIQFSSLKKLDEATLLISNNIEKGITVPGGNKTIGGFGMVSVGTTNNDAVGISKAGYPYFVRAMEIALQAHNNDLNTLPADTTYNQVTPGTEVSQTALNQIFAYDKNRTENYWHTEYEKYIKVIEQTPTFLSLDNPINKVYYTYPNWNPGEPANNSSSYSYADLPNRPIEMMPLNEWGTQQNPLSQPNFTDLDAWFKEYQEVPNNPKESQSRLNSLKQWIINHKQEILQRASFNLVHVLDKKSYEENHGVMKIMLNAPNSPLLDKGFAQSAYMGLYYYWKQYNINLPFPPQ